MKPPTTVYRGERIIGPGGATIGVRVTVNGRELSPRRSQKLWNHSPDGFEWGYSGSGPAQLAMALILDAAGVPGLAGWCYQEFKRQVVSRWGDRWEITAGEIQRWIEKWREDNPRTYQAFIDEQTSFQATAQIEAHRRRMRDPAYLPTIEEALADPEGFVEGMTEVTSPVCSAARKCRVCGCTDQDCSQCIAASGRPCYWMPFDPDLCSRCAEEGGAS